MMPSPTEAPTATTATTAATAVATTATTATAAAVPEMFVTYYVTNKTRSTGAVAGVCHVIRDKRMEAGDVRLGRGRRMDCR